MSKYDPDYYQKNKDRINAYDREYYKKNREKIRAQQQKNRNKPEAKKVAREYAIKYRLKKGEELKQKKKDWYYKNEVRFKRYGITQKVFNQMFTKQKGRCAICLQEKPLVIDHSHNPNRVRGLLCHSCNKGLGCFYDNPSYLENAKEYVSTQKISE